MSGRTRCGSIVAFALAVVCVAQPRAAAALSADRAQAVDAVALLELLADADAPLRAAQLVASCEVASSRDQASMSRSDARAWFSNDDQGNAIRIQRFEGDGGGRSEWVLADASGAGAVVRLFVAVDRDILDAVLRVRIDGAATPVAEWTLGSLLSEDAGPALPLREIIGSGARGEAPAGVTVLLPMPFARGCVVTLDRKPGEYQIALARFAAGTEVKPLDGSGLSAVVEACEVVARKLDSRAKPAVRAEAPAREPLPIARGERVATALSEAGTVRELLVEVEPSDLALALRDLWVVADFDGEACVRAPLGHLFGLGDAVGTAVDRFRDCRADGTLRLWMPMPFARSATLVLENRGTVPLRARLEAMVAPAAAADGAWHFHARFREVRGVRPLAPVEIELARIDGDGVVVGSTLAVQSPVRGWWGAGDERIETGEGAEVAGTSASAQFGCAGWYPRMHAGRLVSVRTRGVATAEDGGGRSAASRTRVLDAVPFRGGMRWTQEIFPSEPAGGEFAVAQTTMWYARPGASQPRGFDDPTVMPPLHGAPNRARLAQREPGWVEAEECRIVDFSAGARWDPLLSGELAPEHAWGNGLVLMLRGVKVGEWIEFEVPASGESPQRLSARFSRGPDHGRIAVEVNGRRVVEDHALYAEKLSPDAAIDLGVHEPRDGAFVVRIATVGFGDGSIIKMFAGIDAFRVQPREVSGL